MQKPAQRRDEMASVQHIAPPNRCPDVIPQHDPDLLRTIFAFQQGGAEHSRERIGDVLVLRNGVDLIRRQVAKADQVFESDHGSSSQILLLKVSLFSLLLIAASETARLVLQQLPEPSCCSSVAAGRA